MTKTVPLRPEHIDPLAQALYTEWHDFTPWSSVGKICVYYETCLQGGGLPVVFAAVDGQDRLLDSSAFKRHNITTLPQHEYWLDGIFVLPPYHGKGVGRLPVEHCLDTAHEMRLPALCLYTPDMQAVYEKYGWREIKRRWHNSEIVPVMKLGL